jgi:outer membrane receptor protein involved in Fe transport
MAERALAGARCSTRGGGVRFVVVEAARDPAASPPAPAQPSRTARNGGADQAASGPDLLRARPSVTRAEELFEGRFPGVQVYRASGGVVVRVRGQSSLSGNDEPAVRDRRLPAPAGSGGLLDINPNDIAKIEVLKDPVSLAEYGSRGRRRRGAHHHEEGR